MIRPIENLKTKERITQLKDVSRRRIEAGERVVERGFHKARLLVTLAAGLLLVGFLLVAQWRGNATLTASPERQSDQNLAIIIGQLTAENSALRSEIMRLETRILDAERETKDRSQVLNDAAQELRALRVMTGIEPAVGPGVFVRLIDAERVLLPQDFVALVNELRAAGAEAVAVNDVRVDARAGFTGRDGVIRLGDAVLSRDFEVIAIGDPANLEQSLTLPGGLRSTLSTFPGVTVTVERSERLRVPAAQEPTFKIGEPVEE